MQPTAKPIVFLALAGAFLLAPPAATAAPHPASGQARVALPRGLHAVQAVRVRTLASPRGTFTLQAPAGWTFRPDGADDAAIAVAPSGRTLPAAFIWGMIPVNQIAASLAVQDPFGNPGAWVQAQFRAMERQETAAEAVESLASAVNRGLLPEVGISNMRIVALGSRSPSVAELRVRYIFRGAPIDEHAFVRLVYLLNPAYTALAGRPMWDTFAFVAGCSAPAGSLASAERPCGLVLKSFRPGPTWLQSQLIQYFENQQNQIGMIQQTLNRIYQMQNEAAAALRDTTFKVGVDWTQVLGASTRLIDPRTGDRYETYDNTWSYYCVRPLADVRPPNERLLGTDDPSLIASPACDRELKRTDP